MGRKDDKDYLLKIVPIRISVEHWGQIKKEADRMGIGVSTLTRIWVMESLQKLAEGQRLGREYNTYK